MKQAIITALNGKFTGVSEAILGRVADKLISSGKVKKTEDIADAVAGVTFQSVLENYGDSRADEAQKTAVKNYENKHHIKDGKPVDGGNNGGDKSAGVQTSTGQGGANLTTSSQQPEAETPAWAQAIIEQNKALSERLDAMQQEKTTNNRQQQLADILKDAPDSVRSRYEKDFGRMTFKDDDDFTSWLTELTPEVQKITADFGAKGGVVTKPLGGQGNSGNTEPNPYLKARVEERAQAATTAPAIQGLS
ncbi:MAG: hypothetical protein K2G35_08610 [Duncaniella sp.]|nr:hypothetical protein [Duncaniella sp.]